MGAAANRHPSIEKVVTRAAAPDPRVFRLK